MARNSGSAFGRGPGNSITILIPGLGAFLGRFQQRKAGLTLSVEGAASDVADDIVIAAKDLVAVDTGATRDNIRKEKRGGDWYVVSDRGGDRDVVPIYLEIGTMYMAARPFMKPAADMVMASGGFAERVKMRGGLLGPVGKLHT